MAFSHLYHTERLRNINQAKPHYSYCWRRHELPGLAADIRRYLPGHAEIVDVKEHGTTGTAMTAAVMVGWFAEVFSASNDMVHVSRTVSLIRKTTGSTRPNTSFIKTCYQKCSRRGKAAATTSRTK